MALPQQFLSYSNFELAFTRVVRSSHKEYKQFYRHLFSSYNLAPKENLGDRIKDIKSGTYRPGKPTVIFQPKENTILRPLVLLSLCDLIVYQALFNVIAAKFEKIQGQYALIRSFGAIYAGKGSPFFRSLRGKGQQWIIDDSTKFKFSLLRLNPRRDVLKRVARLLVRRPDCFWVLAAYLRKFPEDKSAADILLGALRQDPIYDAAAANYIEAMDVCEPAIQNPKYQRVIQMANRRSEEKSILLAIASLTFRGRRLGPKDAAKLFGRQKNPIVKGILLHRLFGNDPEAPYKLTDCAALLEKEVDGDDADLARFCASLLLPDWPLLVAGAWRPPKAAPRSVKLLMLGLGLRARAPRKRGVLDAYFRDKMRIPIPICWRKALDGDWPDAERRCFRLQQLQVGDPTARVMMLDTFNEVLLQAFSRKHSSLVSAYSKAAGKASRPDFGNWLNHPLLATVLPSGITWFRNVHRTRVGADLAHAKRKGGSKKGASTKPVTFGKADALMKRAPAAWVELIMEWKKIL